MNNVFADRVTCIFCGGNCVCTGMNRNIGIYKFICTDCGKRSNKVIE